MEILYAAVCCIILKLFSFSASFSNHDNNHFRIESTVCWPANEHKSPKILLNCKYGQRQWSHSKGLQSFAILSPSQKQILHNWKLICCEAEREEEEKPVLLSPVSVSSKRYFDIYWINCWRSWGELIVLTFQWWKMFARKPCEKCGNKKRFYGLWPVNWFLVLLFRDCLKKRIINYKRLL